MPEQNEYTGTIVKHSEIWFVIQPDANFGLNRRFTCPYYKLAINDIGTRVTFSTDERDRVTSIRSQYQTASGIILATSYTKITKR